MIKFYQHEWEKTDLLECWSNQGVSECHGDERRRGRHTGRFGDDDGGGGIVFWKQ